MITVRFVRDYSGPLTKGNYYPAGDVVTLADMTAAGLVAEGAAVLVAPPPVSAPVVTFSTTGAAPALPVITITGPVSDVVVTNLTTGEEVLPVAPAPVAAKKAARKSSKKAAKP